MASKTITFSDYPSGRSVYLRVFDSAGLVLDFDDGTFKALAGATEPYVAATERSDMGGTGRSGYQATLDLATVHNGPGLAHFTVQAYENAAPDDADNPIGDPLELPVQLGQYGPQELVACGDVNVKSTAGDTAQLTAWLERRNGDAVEKVDLDAIGGTVITADAGTDFLTAVAHGRSNGDVVLLSTDDTLPAGLAAATAYYVVNKTTDTFQLALSSGGAAIDLTDAGTGTHKFHFSTATVTLREHGSGGNLFAKTIGFDKLFNNVFEAEQSAPNFTDDRQYELSISLNIEGTTIARSYPCVVIG